MRILFVFILLAPLGMASAQNWALFPAGVTNNYCENGNSLVISNQVFITDTQSLGGDSMIYSLNRIAARLQPTCTVQDNLAQFVQDNWLVSNGIWVAGEAIDYSIHALAPVGSSWVFETTTMSTANIVSAGVQNFWGAADSVKVINTSAGGEITISKNHGIVKWQLAGQSVYELIGTNNPNTGLSMPSVNDYYSYQVGDVIEYSFENLAGVNTLTRVKYTVLQRTDTVGRVELSCSKIQRRVFDSNPPSVTTGTENLTFPGMFMVDSILVGYPGQLVAGGQIICPPYDSSDPLSSKLIGGTLPNGCVDLFAINGWSWFGDGFGLMRADYGDFQPFFTTNRLVGNIINGVQWGDVTPDSVIRKYG